MMVPEAVAIVMAPTDKSRYIPSPTSFIDNKLLKRGAILRPQFYFKLTYKKVETTVRGRKATNYEASPRLSCIFSQVNKIFI